MSELQESVEKGARDRAAVVRRFGFVPTSILRLKRGQLSKSIYNMAMEKRLGRVQGANSIARVETFKTAKSRAKAEQRRAAGLFGSINEYTGTNRETLSVMAAELPDFFARYYARPGQTYIDPFAGHGVRMQVAHLLGMNYLGMDAAIEFVRYMQAIRAKLDVADGQRVEITRGDSRHPDTIPDDSGDFCFTSPPYWDVEWYGPEPEQLGTGHTYPEFLDGMRDVAHAWYPKFKSGGWCVLNVNDLRREGVFLSYHADTIDIWRSAGFVLHDIWIVEGLVSGLPKAFAVSFNLQRIAPKVHEYAIVMRKP